MKQKGTRFPPGAFLLFNTKTGVDAAFALRLNLSESGGAPAGSGGVGMLMSKRLFFWLCVAAALSGPAWGTTYETIYTSQNLSDFKAFSECDPGCSTNCPGCDDSDSSISFAPTYAMVTSNNAPKENIWVNAIGGYTFTETFPDGDPILPGVYKYAFEARLPEVPNQDVEEAPESMELVFSLWDGRQAIYPTDKISLEAGLWWQLNPWNAATYGKVYLWAGYDPITKLDTGITLTPDTQWHRFELVADFINKRYVSMTVDDQTVDLRTTDLPRVHRPAWGNEIAFLIKAESLAAWPEADCQHDITWTTHFRNVELSYSGSLTSIPALSSYGLAVMVILAAGTLIYFMRKPQKA